MNSKRAAIFAEVLKYVDAGDWSREDGFLVFGTDAYNAYLAADTEETSGIDEATREFAHQIKVLKGRKALHGRFSMTRPPQDAAVSAGVQFLTALPEEDRESLIASLQTDQDPEPEQDISDDIDAALAASMIVDLENRCTRALSLDPLEISPKSFNTAAYFDEAHKCDSFGLKIAAAVLCRAILEDSLKKIVDENGQIRTKTERSDSYFSAMLREAQRVGLLDKNRVDRAEEVKLAGNMAVHDLSVFKVKYASKMTELVDEMRKVLEDLSRDPS